MTPEEAATYLQEIKAEVWDSAYALGVADAFTSYDLTNWQIKPARINPYRPPTVNS